MSNRAVWGGLSRLSLLEIPAPTPYYFHVESDLFVFGAPLVVGGTGYINFPKEEGRT